MNLGCPDNRSSQPNDGRRYVEHVSAEKYRKIKIHKSRIYKYTQKCEIDLWVSLWVKKLPNILCVEKPCDKHGKPATNKVIDITQDWQSRNRCTALFVGVARNSTFKVTFHTRRTGRAMQLHIMGLKISHLGPLQATTLGAFLQTKTLFGMQCAVQQKACKNIA